MPLSRRRLLAASAALSPALFSKPGAFAQELEKTLALTPRQTEGPFYPDALPLDTDNDLLVLNDALTPAVGTVTHLSGRVLSAAGEPVRGATVEIWQADANGNYIHSRGGSGDAGKPRDAGFQGFGRFLTDAAGRYYFRTIRPVPYGGRAPHVHVAVNRKNERLLTTQCYVKGDPGNARDGVIRRTVRQDGQDALNRLMVEFSPIKNSAAGELAATFDLVLGVTPADEGER